MEFLAILGALSSIATLGDLSISGIRDIRTKCKHWKCPDDWWQEVWESFQQYLFVLDQLIRIVENPSTHTEKAMDDHCRQIADRLRTLCEELKRYYHEWCDTKFWQKFSQRLKLFLWKNRGDCILRELDNAKVQILLCQQMLSLNMQAEQRNDIESILRKVEALQTLHSPEPTNSEPQPTPGNMPEGMDESISEFQKARPKSKAKLRRLLPNSFISKIKGYVPSSSMTATECQKEANDATEVTKDPAGLPELSEIEAFLIDHTADHTAGLAEHEANSDSQARDTEDSPSETQSFTQDTSDDENSLFALSCSPGSATDHESYDSEPSDPLNNLLKAHFEGLYERICPSLESHNVELIENFAKRLDIRDLPATLGLLDLIQVSVLSVIHEVHDVLASRFQHWATTHAETFLSFEEELLLLEVWALVCLVFRLKKHFRKATSILQRKATKPLTSRALPAAIVYAINQKRNGVLDTITLKLQEMIRLNLQDEVQAPNANGAMAPEAEDNEETGEDGDISEAERSSEYFSDSESEQMGPSVIVTEELHGRHLANSLELGFLLREGQRWGLLDHEGKSNNPYNGTSFDLVLKGIEGRIDLKGWRIHKARWIFCGNPVEELTDAQYELWAIAREVKKLRYWGLDMDNFE